MPLKCSKSSDCPGSKVCGRKRFCKKRSTTTTKRRSMTTATKRRSMTTATKRRSMTARRRPSRSAASTSLVAGAVLDQVGPMTAQSLMTKRRSKALGAGMGTMVSLTRRKLRKM